MALEEGKQIDHRMLNVRFVEGEETAKWGVGFGVFVDDKYVGFISRFDGDRCWEFKGGGKVLTDKNLEKLMCGVLKKYLVSFIKQEKVEEKKVHKMVRRK